VNDPRESQASQTAIACRKLDERGRVKKCEPGSPYSVTPELLQLLNSFPHSPCTSPVTRVIVPAN
jgi:hypothetical protein